MNVTANKLGYCFQSELNNKLFSALVATSYLQPTSLGSPPVVVSTNSYWWNSCPGTMGVSQHYSKEVSSAPPHEDFHLLFAGPGIKLNPDGIDRWAVVNANGAVMRTRALFPSTAKRVRQGTYCVNTQGASSGSVLASLVDVSTSVPSAATIFAGKPSSICPKNETAIFTADIKGNPIDHAFSVVVASSSKLLPGNDPSPSSYFWLWVSADGSVNGTDRPAISVVADNNTNGHYCIFSADPSFGDFGTAVASFQPLNARDVTGSISLNIGKDERCASLSPNHIGVWTYNEDFKNQPRPFSMVIYIVDDEGGE